MKKLKITAAQAATLNSIVQDESKSVLTTAPLTDLQVTKLASALATGINSHIDPTEKDAKAQLRPIFANPTDTEPIQHVYVSNFHGVKAVGHQLIDQAAAIIVSGDMDEDGNYELFLIADDATVTGPDTVYFRENNRQYNGFKLGRRQVFIPLTWNYNVASLKIHIAGFVNYESGMSAVEAGAGSPNIYIAADTMQFIPEGFAIKSGNIELTSGFVKVPNKYLLAKGQFVTKDMTSGIIVDQGVTTVKVGGQTVTQFNANGVFDTAVDGAGDGLPDTGSVVSE